MSSPRKKLFFVIFVSFVLFVVPDSFTV